VATSAAALITTARFASADQRSEQWRSDETTDDPRQLRRNEVDQVRREVTERHALERTERHQEVAGERAHHGGQPASIARRCSAWVAPNANGNTSQGADMPLTVLVQGPSKNRLPRYWSPAPNTNPTTPAIKKITRETYELRCYASRRTGRSPSSRDADNAALALVRAAFGGWDSGRRSDRTLGTALR